MICNYVQCAQYAVNSVKSPKPTRQLESESMVNPTGNQNLILLLARIGNHYQCHTVSKNLFLAPSWMMTSIGIARMPSKEIGRYVGKYDLGSNSSLTLVTLV